MDSETQTTGANTMTQTSLFNTARKSATPKSVVASPKAQDAEQRNTEIAQTILDQLGGTGRLVAMTGAHNFMTDGPSIQFKFNNRAPAPNYCKITLDACDTYTVLFSRVSKSGQDNASAIEFIYADQLVELFENTTGLYLSL